MFSIEVNQGSQGSQLFPIGGYHLSILDRSANGLPRLLYSVRYT